MISLRRPLLRVRASAQLAGALMLSRTSPAAGAARRHRTAFYRDLWSAAAAELGAPAEVTGGGAGALEIVLGGQRVRVHGTHCSIDGPDVLAVAGDKVLVYRLLAAAGLPVPRHWAFTLASLDRARRFLREAPGACVVKPARDTAAGRGVTTGVRQPRDLERACIAAAASGAQASRAGRGAGPLRRLKGMFAHINEVPLLIEHQVAGENYRLLYLDGVLIDAIRRGAPTATGDGYSSVAELLDRLNTERLRAGGKRAQMLVTRGLDLEHTLADQQLTLTTTPPAGAVVRLKTAVNENAPENNWPARSELCQSIVEQGAQAAAAVGTRFAGVDVITTDATVPLVDSGGCILEVNTTPGLAMHYHGHVGEIAPATLLLTHLSSTREVSP